MKAIELRELTIDELKVREDELNEELARLRIQLSVKRLDNPLQIRVTRRELSRVKTVLSEKLRATEARETAGEADGPAGAR